MGQKVHPIGLRTGIIRTWNSHWFKNKSYREWLYEDAQIRKYLQKRLRAAGVSLIEIERPDAENIVLTLHAARPGLVIEKKGSGIEELRKYLRKMTHKEIKLNVREVRQPELSARLVAENVVDQIQKRVAFRRAMKQAVSRTMRSGAKGIKIVCKGRLGGSEIARAERVFEGSVPLHTLRADIDYDVVEAYTTYGRIGVKVWIYKGDILPIKNKEQAASV